MTDHGAGEAGHPLAALTEALDSLDDIADTHRIWRTMESDRLAAALLAHPAMADLARKAAIGEAVEMFADRLPRGASGALAKEGGHIGGWVVQIWQTGTVDPGSLWLGGTLPATIAAALEQGG